LEEKIVSVKKQLNDSPEDEGTQINLRVNSAIVENFLDRKQIVKPVDSSPEQDKVVHRAIEFKP
jgi:hypothetical protein